MKLQYRTLTSGNNILECDKNMYIAELKVILSANTKLIQGSFYLLHKDTFTRLENDDYTLEDYDVQDNDTINVILNLRGD